MKCVLACLSIIAWLNQHPEYDAARRDAVLRQVWTESRFEPCVVARSGSSYLMQWVNPRLAALHRFAGVYGCPPVAVQLEFMDRELRSTDHLHRFFDVPGDMAFAYFRQTYGRGM